MMEDLEIVRIGLARSYSPLSASYPGKICYTVIRCSSILSTAMGGPPGEIL